VDNEDFDGATGYHLCEVDTSDNTDAGFYAAGHTYHVMCFEAVVDGQTVNVDIGSFYIGYATGDGPATALALAAILGTDGLVLISTDAQDLSGSLIVNAGTVTLPALALAAIKQAMVNALFSTRRG
jgi:hypothetical protein